MFNLIKVVFLCLILLPAMSCEQRGSFYSDSPSVRMVKTGSFFFCSHRTVEEIVDSFMGSPSWESLHADDGHEYVNIWGDIEYAGNPVRALIQFRISGISFEFYALEFNGVPQSEFLANTLLEKMCESY